MQHILSCFLIMSGLVMLSAPALAQPKQNLANSHFYDIVSVDEAAADYWVDAAARASALGGRLVTINDAAEQAWIYGNIISGTYRNYWIGLNDSLTEGALVWQSGETSDYRNWDENYQNTAGRDYAYIRQSDGQWDMGYKTDYKLGIAEWSVAPEPASCVFMLCGSIMLLALRRTRGL